MTRKAPDRCAVDAVRAFVDPLPLAAAVLREGRLLHVNKAFTRIFGYTQKDIAAGLRIQDLAGAKGEPLEECLRQAATVRVNLRTRGRGTVPVDAAVSQMSVGKGTVDVLVLHDASEQVRAERSLRREIAARKRLATAFTDSEEKYRVLAESPGEAIATSERERADRELRDREAKERNLRERLTLLHGIANELSMAGSVDECCRQAIELARSRLGFARVGIWFGEGHVGEVAGTYGVDESGNIRDERRSRLRYERGSAMGQVMTGKKVYVLRHGAPLLNHKGKVVGTGSLIVAALWDGRAVTGFVCADTHPAGRELDDTDGQVLALFASDVGYLCSRKRTEVALRESEQNFRALAENANEAIFIDRAGGQHLYANRVALRLTRYTKSELLAMTMAELIVPRERERTLAYTKMRLAGKPVPQPYDTVLVDKRGREIPVEVMGSVTQWHGKTATIGVIRDVSRRKQAEEALRRSQDMLTRAQGLTNSGSWDWDLTTDDVIWSRQMYGLYGLSPRSFKPSYAAIMKHLPTRDVQLVAGDVKSALAGEVPFDVEHRVVMPDGTQRIHISRAEVIRDAKGKPVRLAGSVMDITERRRLEREILEISGREQRRIGQDLHDTLGQELIGIGFLCKALQRSLAADGSREAENAARINTLVVESVDHARRIAAGIFPVAVEEEGLAAALRGMARRTEQMFQVKCRYTIGKQGKVFDNLIATHVYYIAQEAVSNAVRHGRPSRITIQLVAGPRMGRLVVRNDGVKPVLPSKSGKGMGLRIMRYRAGVIGGSVRLEGRRSGASLTCKFENRKAAPGS